MPKPIEHPTDLQLVTWARGNGALARIAPNENIPTPRTLFLLRGIYAASLHHWKRKAGQVARQPPVQVNMSLRQRLSAILAAMPQSKRQTRK